jgi:phage N-6-adenine-methyltransferase
MTTVVTTTLVECEAIIERGLGTFVEVGEALLAIRDERLYRDTHGTFEDYCRERWGFNRQRASQLIGAAEVSNMLDNAPPNARVAAELAPLRAEPEVVREAWAQAVEQHGPTPTAAQVREVVEPRRAEPTVDKMAVHYSSATDEWSTPQPIFDVLDAEFRFTLDVCALDSSAKCGNYFTPETDGLAHDWLGTCWMNPPYGGEIARWVEKAATESKRAGTTVVCLLPARVDTGWWWDHCRHAEIRFLRGRLKFGTADAGAPFPSAVVVFGHEPTVLWWEWR